MSAPVVSDAEVRQRFRELAADWKAQSRYLSNTAQMAMLKPYQRIIGMIACSSAARVYKG